ncbi:hypothetical protein ACFODL_18860 [Phenylobacterium terrae]|uniref:Uncharacterized protein n=1 Tax=Phenylobacterium terrae TaxID=2665495 RepID=A0ABW4N0L6_9CAUL
MKWRLLDWAVAAFVAVALAATVADTVGERGEHIAAAPAAATS